MREAQQAAAAWVKGHGNALERASQDAFVRTGTFEGDNSIYSMAYERTHEGLRVVGGDFVVLANAAGQVVGSSVAQEAPVEIGSTTAKIDAARATAGRPRRWPTRARRPPRPSWSSGTATPAPSWRTRSRCAAPTPARSPGRGSGSTPTTGDVLESREQIAHGSGTAAYSGPNPLPIATSGSGSSYSMTDPTATTLKCQDAATNTTFTGTDDLWGNGNATNRETGCVDALYAAQQMKAMMSSWLGRNGMNGTGGWVPIRVGLNDINAYYDGTQVQIGKNQAGALDLRRWTSWPTSSATASTTRPPAASPAAARRSSSVTRSRTATEYYDNQPAPYDRPDHTIGEEVNLVGQGPIRDGSNPANVGDPSCYTSSIPTAEVHAAAGPGDHWFYLLSRGGVSKCDGTSTTGIGEQAAIKVLYNAMLMKTSSSNYLKYRTWTLTAAKNLDSTCAQFNAVEERLGRGQRAGPDRRPDVRWHHHAARPPRRPPVATSSATRASSPARPCGPAPPARSRTTPAARPAPARGRRGSAATARTGTETINQSVTIPSTATAATLSYWIRTDTAETGSTAYDTMRVQVVDGSTATTLRTFTNVGTNATYTQFSHALTAYKGKTVTIRFTMTEDSSLQTSFVVDDTAVNVS